MNFAERSTTSRLQHMKLGRRCDICESEQELILCHMCGLTLCQSCFTQEDQHTPFDRDCQQALAVSRAYEASAKKVLREATRTVQIVRGLSDDALVQYHRDMVGHPSDTHLFQELVSRLELERRGIGGTDAR